MPNTHAPMLRKERMRTVHESNESALHSLHMQGQTKIPLQVRHHLTKSLIDIKRHKDLYDFSPTQLKLLDMLIKKSREARTPEDLLRIHGYTCGLALNKH